MRGCGRACLVQLAVWLVLSGAIGLWLQLQRDDGPSVWLFGLAAGLFAAMALSIFHSITITARERKLLRQAGSTLPPEDGSWAVAAGEIRTRQPLTSPLSQTQVVAYEYSVHRMQRVGKSHSQVTYFDGKALAPSVISTGFGSVRLLAVPTLEIETDSIDKQKGIRNANALAATATFADRTTGTARTAALEAEWTDDDGQFRIDRRHSDTPVALTPEFTFHERIVRQGEIVCAFGIWSAERGGIIPDARWGRTPRLVRGSSETIARSLSSRIFRYTLAALVLAAVAAGIMWFWIHAVRSPGPM